MKKTPPTLALAAIALAACNSVPPSRTPELKPEFSGLVPATAAPVDPDPDEAQRALPVGVGITTGPSSFLLGATLDLPIDKKLTVGPALRYGMDDSFNLISVGGQLKYFFDITENDSGSFALQPYATGGVGVVQIDPDRAGSDSGLELNLGAGLRYRTGEQFRLGSELRWCLMPDKVAGESSYIAFELLQVVFTF